MIFTSYRKYKPRPTLILGSISLRRLKNSKWRKRWHRHYLLQEGKKMLWVKVRNNSRDQFNRSIKWCRWQKAGTVLRIRQLLWTSYFRRKVIMLQLWETSSIGNLLEKWVKGHMVRLRPWTVLICQIAREHHNTYWKRIKLSGIAHRLLQIMLRHHYQLLIRAGSLSR